MFQFLKLIGTAMAVCDFDMDTNKWSFYPYSNYGNKNNVKTTTVGNQVQYEVDKRVVAHIPVSTTSNIDSTIRCDIK